MPLLSTPISFHSDLAVVPIAMNVGAAVLPALLAGAASFFSLLLRPRELVRACARKPVTTGVTLTVIAGIATGLYFLIAQVAQPAKAETHFWELVVDRALAPKDIAAGTHVAVTTHLTLGRNYARINYDGGPWPEGLVKEAGWSEETGGYVLGCAAVRDGRVYGAGNISTFSGPKGVLFCRDADTGKEIWRRESVRGDEPLPPIWSSPAITADGKHMIVGQGLHEDANCQLLCLDTATGKVLWAADTILHIESSPALFTHPKYGDIAVVGCGAIEGGPDHKPTTDPGHVICVQVSTGKVLWKHAVIDPECSPAIGDDGTVYIGAGFNGNYVVALRSETDEDLAGAPREIWRRDTPFPATGTVTLYNGMVIMGCGNGDFVNVAPDPQGRVLALDAKTGKEIWTFDAGDSVLAEVAARDGMLLAPCKSGEVIAIDAKEGKKLWSVRVSGRNDILAGIAFTGPRAYAVSKDGWLAVVDTAPGAPKRILERIFINDEKNRGDQGLCSSAPVIAGGRIYVGTETAGIRCIPGKTLGKK